MFDPGFARPDLCSIRAADEQKEFAEAARRGLSADGHPVAGDNPLAPQRAMSPALPSRHTFGYSVRQLGTGGARLVTGRRAQRTEAGR